MHSFNRLASFLLFVFSSGLLTSVLPTAPGGSNAISTRYGNSQADAMVAALVILDVNVKARVNALVDMKTVDELELVVNPLAANIQACAKVIVALGIVKVDTTARADISAKVAAIILVTVKACVDISAKFGLTVIIGIFDKIYLALKLLLVNLGICVEGILVIIAKVVASTCNDLLVKLCLSVLALVRL